MQVCDGQEASLPQIRARPHTWEKQGCRAIQSKLQMQCYSLTVDESILLQVFFIFVAGFWGFSPWLWAVLNKCSHLEVQCACILACAEDSFCKEENHISVEQDSESSLTRPKSLSIFDPRLLGILWIIFITFKNKVLWPVLYCSVSAYRVKENKSG